MIDLKITYLRTVFLKYYTLIILTRDILLNYERKRIFW